jgi:hypothetical protein
VKGMSQPDISGILSWSDVFTIARILLMRNGF